ncbi:MAG: 16S rRNA (guanine(527)-N(7))-methyltransferase RsmG [Rickettsiaceae bacterium]
MLINYKVSREIITPLKEYEKLLKKWNKVINLVSRKSLEDCWNRHILDSLQLINFIKDKDIELVDLGSGAGLPGIILSIAGVKHVTLIEPNKNKCAFLHEASKISKNSITIIQKKVENIDITCDILVARAFSSIEKILKSGVHVRHKYLLLRGVSYDNKLSDAKIYQSITGNGKIVEL